MRIIHAARMMTKVLTRQLIPVHGELAFTPVPVNLLFYSWGRA